MKFVINKSLNLQYYFTIVASNGQKLCTSETYTTKQAAKDTITSIKTYASNASVEDNS